MTRETLAALIRDASASRRFSTERCAKASAVLKPAASKALLLAADEGEGALDDEEYPVSGVLGRSAGFYQQTV